MAIATLIQRKVGPTFRSVLDNPRALGAILGGAFSGPFLGVTLSLFALQNTSVGIASTLMALSPIFLLPVEAYHFKQRVSWGGVLGTVAALLGVGVLFLF